MAFWQLALLALAGAGFSFGLTACIVVNFQRKAADRRWRDASRQVRFAEMGGAVHGAAYRNGKAHDHA